MYICVPLGPKRAMADVMKNPIFNGASFYTLAERHLLMYSVLIYSGLIFQFCLT